MECHTLCTHKQQLRGECTETVRRMYRHIRQQPANNTETEERHRGELAEPQERHQRALVA